MSEAKFLIYENAKFLIVREGETYFITARQIDQTGRIVVYFFAKSRVVGRNVIGVGSAHVISSLKWEESFTPDEVKFVKKILQR